MKHSNWILFGFVVILALGLILATGCARKEAGEQAETQEMEPAAAEPEIEIPARCLGGD